MSIIAEALKRAEKEKGKKTVSKEYVNKILGPERKGVYKREEFRHEKAQLRPRELSPAGEPAQETASFSDRKKAWVASGVILVLGIIFLTIINAFFLPSDLEMAGRGKVAGYTKVQPEAEAYTDITSEVGLIERTGAFGVSQTEAMLDELKSELTLSGIVYDVNDSWVVINNKILRTGDALNGAKVISIEPERVILTFREEEFDLVVH